MQCGVYEAFEGRTDECCLRKSGVPCQFNDAAGVPSAGGDGATQPSPAAQPAPGPEPEAAAAPAAAPMEEQEVLATQSSPAPAAAPMEKQEEVLATQASPAPAAAPMEEQEEVLDIQRSMPAAAAPMMKPEEVLATQPGPAAAAAPTEMEEMPASQPSPAAPAAPAATPMEVAPATQQGLASAASPAAYPMEVEEGHDGHTPSTEPEPTAEAAAAAAWNSTQNRHGDILGGAAPAPAPPSAAASAVEKGTCASGLPHQQQNASCSLVPASMATRIPPTPPGAAADEDAPEEGVAAPSGVHTPPQEQEPAQDLMTPAALPRAPAPPQPRPRLGPGPGGASGGPNGLGSKNGPSAVRDAIDAFFEKHQDSQLLGLQPPEQPPEQPHPQPEQAAHAVEVEGIEVEDGTMKQKRSACAASLEPLESILQAEITTPPSHKQRRCLTRQPTAGSAASEKIDCAMEALSDAAPEDDTAQDDDDLSRALLQDAALPFFCLQGKREREGEA